MSGGWIQASVSMPCTASSQSRWRTGVSGAGTGGVSARRTASRHAFHNRCTACRSSSTRSVSLANSGRRRSRARREIGAESRQRLGFFEDPRELAPAAAGMPWSTTARQRSSRDPTPATSSAALAPNCSTSSASTSLGRMRPDASLSRYRDSARYGSRSSRIAACSTASSKGRCSNACSVLW